MSVVALFGKEMSCKSFSPEVKEKISKNAGMENSGLV